MTAVEPIVAKEDVVVTTDDGRQVQVIAGTPVPKRLIAAYQSAIAASDGDSPERVNLELTGKTTDELTALWKADRPSVADVVAAVGDDRALATAVIEAEQAGESPRSTLVSKLEAIANAGT